MVPGKRDGLLQGWLGRNDIDRKTIWRDGFGRVDLRRQGKLPVTVIPSRPLCLSRQIEVPARQEKGEGTEAEGEIWRNGMME